MNLLKHKALLAATVASLLTAALVAQAQVPGPNALTNSIFNSVYDNSTMKPSYSAAAVYAPAASGTDTCSIAGSASKTIKVRQVVFTATGAAAGVTEAIAVIKRSTAYTAGAGGTMAQVPYDSINSLTSSTTNAGTSGLVEYWTGNPTVGTAVGTLADPFVYIGTAILGGARYTFNFGDLASPIVLRGVAQNLAVNLNGVTISGNISCRFEWTEE